MSSGPPAVVQQLAERLSEGFEALSGEYQLLLAQQRQLESKLSWAKQQYLDLLKRSSPDTLAQDHLVFLQDLEHVALDLQRPPISWIDQIAQNDDAERKNHAVLIKQAESAVADLRTPIVDSGVKIWSGPSADRRPTPLRIQTNADMSSIEKDFTTSGTPSKLGCPFAANSARQSPLATPRSSISRMSQRGRRSKRPSFNDPIRAEICGIDDHASASASVEGSAGVCPIRFLDQHDPQDVAKYFEKHKHELPRSHEVCINRFQSNTNSIQELDRKYGDLVSMIQGLGQKHQAWLPEEPEEVGEGPTAQEDEAKTDVKVEKWATAVTASLQNSIPDEDQDELEVPAMAPDETRSPRFDRPLKEIRVGESPSRPWGIHVPAKYTDAESSSSVGSAATASPQLPLDTTRPIGETPPKKPGGCPFGHMVKGDGSKVQEKGTAAEAMQPAMTDAPVSNLGHPMNPKLAVPHVHEPESKHESNPKPNGTPSPTTPTVIPQMVFNGPVFLGYPPEQLAILLQNSNLGAVMR
ncbi:hypothetical protein DPSP01_010452 [Paraphaeosphaeria sporulosa]|uniref:Uncharacterized protein n=1 Tax=Paraphaeosphaeria sporulosa TaxID=1460663 RepID=A0A177CZH6_9PLEO|nr:uncharacterized protein CC84DRAFT_1159592 [Paraphaeosphaeria sporulosa]OAG12250.1 hypothetical protein CC84DRAFT_1159592 [Paraphaeosphaeria sporulosa]